MLRRQFVPNWNAISDQITNSKLVQYPWAAKTLKTKKFKVWFHSIFSTKSNCKTFSFKRCQFHLKTWFLTKLISARSQSYKAPQFDYLKNLRRKRVSDKIQLFFLAIRSTVSFILNTISMNILRGIKTMRCASAFITSEYYKNTVYLSQWSSYFRIPQINLGMQFYHFRLHFDTKISFSLRFHQKLLFTLEHPIADDLFYPIPNIYLRLLWMSISSIEQPKSMTQSVYLWNNTFFFYSVLF